MSFKHRYAKKYLPDSIQKRCDLVLPIYQTLQVGRSTSLSKRQGTMSARSAFAETAGGVGRNLEHQHG